jgi:hypothetical protein
MSRNVTPLIDIVRLEDKETKLKSFIRTVLSEGSVSRTTAGEDIVLVIARSVDSPVVKAVAALVKDGTIIGPVRTILAIVPPTGLAGCDMLSPLVQASCSRGIRDQRLFDAHEQLVLSPAASWVGDCMRRDPMKRDAYECYAADCSKTTGWARLSFERLWAQCDPIVEGATAVEAGLVAPGVLAAVAVEDGSEGHSGSSVD